MVCFQKRATPVGQTTSDPQSASQDDAPELQQQLSCKYYEQKGVTFVTLFLFAICQNPNF